MGSASQWVSSGPSSSRCHAGIVHNIYWGKCLQRIQGRVRHRRGESSECDAGLTPMKWKERRESWVREHRTECRPEKVLTRLMWGPPAKADYWESQVRNSPARIVLSFSATGWKKSRGSPALVCIRERTWGAAGSGSGSACSLQLALLKAGLSWAELSVCPRLTRVICWCFPPSLFRCSDVFGEEIRMLNLSRWENIQGSGMKGKREMQIELCTLKKETV